MPELSLKIAWSRNSALLQYHDKVYLLPQSFLLLIHNKLCDLLSVWVLAACTPATIYNVDDTCEYVRDFVQECCRLAIRYDQQFFSISKVLEGLVIGESLVELEGRSNRQFLRTLSDTLLEDIGFNYDDSMLKSPTLVQLQDIQYPSTSSSLPSIQEC